MAAPVLSPAKVILLAVQLASKENVSALRTLVSKYRKTLRTELVLRIILSNLPESLHCSEYIPLLQDLVGGTIVEDPKATIGASSLEDLSEVEAQRKVRRLHLLTLAWPTAPADLLEEPFVLFLIHRSLRIDEQTGIISQIPELLAPFLHLSHYLRTWLISTILPLVRLYYEYHPDETATISIPAFERLDDEAGIALLLSGTRKAEPKGAKDVVGRDLRGLVGPWMYGDTRAKRRKLRKNSSFSAQTITPLAETPIINEKCASWEEVFRWIAVQATTSWKTAVQVIGQWDGPGDVDLGGYEDSTEWLDEEDQEHLEQRFAQSALAAAYLIPDASLEALNGAHQILSRIMSLMDLGKTPTLEASGALLIPVDGLDSSLSRRDSTFLRNGLLDEQNKLTKPTESSLRFLHTVLISAYLISRAGVSMNVRQAAELALRQDKEDQTSEFSKLMTFLTSKNVQKGDDKFWVRTRNEILWLRSWGAEELGEVAEVGKGIFGKVSKQEVEVAILKAMLANNRLQLAQSLYEKTSEPPLSEKVLHKTVITSAMEAYDNATNPNKTRGGVKRCSDILHAFPDTVADSLDGEQLKHLVDLTHSMEQYRLVFKQGEPFTPVILRVHADPISIIGKILEQNPKTYTKINDFIYMGRQMVNAGLTTREGTGKSNSTSHLKSQQLAVAEKRVMCMCIDTALAEDDFETAYSYVTNQLEVLNGPAHSEVSDLSPPEQQGTIDDDWSWKAALQAGKYRRNSHTIKRIHLGNASGNPEIRHLEQRMDCLSFALRCAPKSALQEILNAYRRCEEELETHVKQEEEQEAAWDAQGDQQAMMPGGFAPVKKPNSSKSSFRPAEEAPMSLFDLSKASMARAQSGLSALSILQGNKNNEPAPVQVRPGSGASGEFGVPKERKRDQLKNAAVGTLASGVGWLIGAPAREGNESS